MTYFVKALVLSIGILIGFTLAKNVAASDLTMSVIKVYDGDTFVSELHGVPEPLNKVSVRIRGIDTPELRGKCSSEVEAAIKSKRQLIAILDSNDTVIVKNVKWDKYGGRIDGDVFLKNGVDVRAEMIKRKAARPYSGEKRVGWCSPLN